MGVVGRRAASWDQVQPRTPYGALAHVLNEARSLAHCTRIRAHKCVCASLLVARPLRSQDHFCSTNAKYPVASFMI